MTFKKSLALVSAVAVAVSAVAPALTSAASEFLTYAQTLASNNVISTQTDEAGYRLSDKITRQEVAKIAANIAKLDTSVVKGTFTDVSSAFAGYVEALANAGIVKTSSTFRPTANITRFEALKIVLGAAKISTSATTASSFADVVAGSEVSAVVEAALANKIISANPTFRPNDSITRGEVFKIAAKISTPSEDADLGSLLGGLFGTGTSTSTGTSTTTTPTTVAAGDLQVALNNASAANGTQIPSTGIIRFAVVDFAAGGSDVALNSVELKKVGLSTVSTSTKVWFEKNGLRVSGKASFTSEGNAVVSFAPALTVKAGTAQTLDLYVELSGSGTAGNDYQFTSGNVSSSAKNVSGSFTTSALRAATYTVATYSGTTASTGSTYKASNDVVELGAFKIENTDTNTDTRDLKFQSITVYQSGAAVLSNLSNLVLVRNGQTVSKSTTVEGKAVTFTLADTIVDGGSATYYIKGNVVNVEQTADAYQFYVKNTSDINVIEAATGFRATTTDASKFTSGLYTVNGGDVKFERDATVALSSNVAPGTAVTLMQGSITAKNAVTLEDVKLTATLSTGSLSSYFTTLYLQIGSSTFSTSAAGTGAEFLGTVTVSGTAAVKLYGTLKSTNSVPAGTIKFSELKLSSFTGTKEYVANQQTVTSSVGSIEGVNLTVDSTALNVSRNDNLGSTTLASGSKGVTLYGAQLSSTKGNPVAVTSASFTFTGTNASTSTGILNNVFATLYVNGTPVTSKTVDTNSAIKFDGFNVTVSSTSTANLVVKADLSETFASGTLVTTLSALNAVDTVSSKDITPSSLPTGATFTIKSADATLADTDSNPSAQMILAGSSKNKLFAFKLTAKNDTVKVKNVYLTGTNLAALSSFVLTDANGTVIATSSSETATAVTFENAQSAGVAMDKSAVYYVAANANSSTNTGSIQLSLSGVTITGTNGQEKSVTGSLASKSHAISENVGVIAKASNASKELTTSALRFNVTVDAQSKDALTLSGLAYDLNISGYTGSAVLKVFKGDNATANLVGQASVSTTGTGVIALNLNSKNTVDAGSTVTYIVAVDGLTVDATANTPSWTVKVTDVTLTGSISSAAYANLGSFPLTEVK